MFPSISETIEQDMHACNYLNEYGNNSVIDRIASIVYAIHRNTFKRCKERLYVPYYRFKWTNVLFYELKPNAFFILG